MMKLVVLLVLVAAAFSWPTKRTEEEYENEGAAWIGAWHATEDDVNNVSPEEAEAYKQILLADVNKMDAAIGALLDLEENEEHAEAVIEGLLFMMELAKHDAENGENDIKALDVGDKYACVAQATSVEGCDEKFGKILGCVRAGVRAVRDTLNADDLSNVQIVEKVKGITNALGREAKNILQLAEECYGGNHWEQAWRATEEEIVNLDDDEIKRYKQLLGADLWRLSGALKAALEGKGTEEHYETIGQAIWGMVLLAKLDAENEDSSVPPAPLGEGYNKGCTRDVFEAAGSCDMKFFTIMTCIQAATQDLLNKLHTLPPVEFVGKAKSVVALIASEAEYIGKEAETCYPPEERGMGQKRIAHTRMLQSQLKRSQMSTANKEELKRLLKEYLNSRK